MPANDRRPYRRGMSILVPSEGRLLRGRAAIPGRLSVAPGTLQASLSRPPKPSRGRPVLSRAASRFVLLLFVVGFVIGAAVEPEPTHPDQAPPLVIEVPGTIAMVATVLATPVGLWLARRWGLWSGVALGVTLIAATAACPGYGHHEVGGWIYVQYAIASGILATSLLLLAATRQAPRPAREFRLQRG